MAALLVSSPLALSISSVQSQPPEARVRGSSTPPSPSLPGNPSAPIASFVRTGVHHGFDSIRQLPRELFYDRCVERPPPNSHFLTRKLVPQDFCRDSTLPVCNVREPCVSHAPADPPTNRPFPLAFRRQSASEQRIRWMPPHRYRTERTSEPRQSRYGPVDGVPVEGS